MHTFKVIAAIEVRVMSAEEFGDAETFHDSVAFWSFKHWEFASQRFLDLGFLIFLLHINFTQLEV